MAAAHVETLLAAWGYGHDRSPTHRALALLASAAPGTSPEQLATLPIGERDRQLVSLRARLFGNVVTGLAWCPGCGEQVEVSFGIGEVLPSGSVPAAGGVLVEQGFEIAYRTPTSADLLELVDDEVSRAPDLLLAHCVQGVRHEGCDSHLDEVPAAVLDHLVGAIEAADPAAQLELAVVCPECEHSWPELFDIAAFVWAEVDHWAHRQLCEVHQLARAYGWQEQDILAMPLHRRQVYLELVGR